MNKPRVICWDTFTFLDELLEVVRSITIRLQVHTNPKVLASKCLDQNSGAETELRGHFSTGDSLRTEDADGINAQAGQRR